MSLWSKQLSQVTFTDIEEFCALQIPEGAQLDYKREIPNDLAKTVAAFANSRGGLILLGVSANQKTNTPDLPIAGMPFSKGLTERVTAICRDNIYPSLIPEHSEVIAHPDNNEQCFIVLRIEESELAPHSITNKTHVYVRTGDTNHKLDILANVDQIESLLDRRRRNERDREQLIVQHLARAKRHFAKDDPLCWWCCVPQFPMSPIFTLEDCRTGADGGGPTRIPNGYAGFATHRYPGQDETRPKDRVYTAISTRGDLFYAHAFRRETNVLLPGPYIAKRTLQNLQHCNCIYNRSNVQVPGLLQYSVGFENVFKCEMQGFNRGELGSPFPDELLRTDRLVRLQELADKNAIYKLAFGIIEELWHGFDIGYPAPISSW
jgi:hypothetical protein